MQLALMDWLIVAAYVAAVIGIGFWAMRRVKDAGGFILGRRKMGKLMMVASTFAGGINANQPISIASATFRSGLSGIWLSLSYMLVMPYMWMYPPVLRRLRVVTMVDYMRMRFGRAMEVLFITFDVVGTCVGLGGGIKGAGDVVLVVTANPDGSYTLPTWAAQAMVVLPTVVYCLMGGLVAVFTTELLQSVLIIVLSFLILPFAVWKVGSMAAIGHAVPASHWNLVASDGNIGTPPWLVWYVLGLIFASANNYGGNALTARNEIASRMMIFGLVFKRFCTIGWALIGIFGVAVLVMHLGLTVPDPDKVFALMTTHVLSQGLRGVMVASVLAAAMSALAGGMVGFSATTVNNLYKAYIVREASSAHYLRMTRTFAALAIVIGWIIASQVDNLVAFIIMIELIATLTGVPKLTCLMWRRVTAYGAVAAVCVMAPLFFIPNWWKVGEFPGFMGWYTGLADRLANAYHAIGAPAVIKAGEKLPVQIWTPIYLLPGLATLVIVSLLTRQHNPAKVQEFYDRLDTPLGEEEKLRAKGYQVDLLEGLDHKTVVVEKKDHDVSRRLFLLDFLRWPYLLATGRARLSDWWVDLVGIAGTIGFVIAFLWMVRVIAGLFH